MLSPFTKAPNHNYAITHELQMRATFTIFIVETCNFQNPPDTITIFKHNLKKMMKVELPPGRVPLLIVSVQQQYIYNVFLIVLFLFVN